MASCSVKGEVHEDHFKENFVLIIVFFVRLKVKNSNYCIIRRRKWGEEDTIEQDLFDSDELLTITEELLEVNVIIMVLDSVD